MEPIKINVNVEIGLKQTTIDTLRLFFSPQITAGPCLCALEEEPQPQPQGADPDGTGAEYDDDDLSPGDAPDPVKKTPTESDARKAVAAAKKRGVTTAAIKRYMKTAFDISSSVECPAERRQELIDGLNRLAA